MGDKCLVDNGQNDLLDMEQEIVSTAVERHCGALTHAAPMYAGLIPFGSLIVALALWWWKRESPYVARHARSSINFQLSMLIYYGLGIGYVYVYAAFGLILLASSAVFETISIVQATRRAKAGQHYDYCFTLRFVKDGKVGTLKS